MLYGNKALVYLNKYYKYDTLYGSSKSKLLKGEKVNVKSSLLDEAIKQLTKGIESSKINNNLISIRAEAYDKLGNLKKANDDYITLIAIWRLANLTTGDQIKAHGKYGLFLQKHRNNEALNYLVKCIKTAVESKTYNETQV